MVDVFRGCGLTEASDPMVCEGTVWLLESQRKDGAWPVQFNGDAPIPGDPDKSPYDLIHPVWTATQALRDRDFQIRRNYAWAEHIQKVTRDSNFGKLCYKKKW